MRLRSVAASLGSGLAVTALALASLVAHPIAAEAQENPYQRGPNPTDASLRAASGPYATSSTSVSSLSVSGFGGGRIYYPTTTSDGTFGAVVIAPGYTAGSTSYLSLAERVASHGFVAFAIDTITRSDFPDSRGDQILAALDYLTSQSSVRSRIDSSRLAAAGHSMGGGGTLAAADERPSLQAAVALQPWHTTKTWSGIRVPTMIIGAEDDTVASVTSHSEPFYESIPGQLGEGLRRAQQRGPLRRQLQPRRPGPGHDHVAEALRGRRHPLRAAHVPAPDLVGLLGVA